MDARRYASLPDPFPMWRGGALHGARIAYETWGTLNAARDNAILLFTGLSPTAHAASSDEDPARAGGRGWSGRDWRSTRRASSSSASIRSAAASARPARPPLDPATGQPYRLSFPDLSVEDIARGGYEIARSLHIERLDTVMGPSLGGMVVLAFAAHVSRRGAAAVLHLGHGGGGAVRDRAALHPARGHHQRSGLEERPVRRRGAADHRQRVARKLGTITYRSAAEWAQRFGRQPIRAEMAQGTPFASEFAVQGYLESLARKWTNVFDANCYLYISRAMDRFELGKHGEPVALFRRAQLDAALVIGVQSDLLFSVTEQRAWRSSSQDGRRTPRASRRCRASRGTTRSWWTLRPSGARSVRF